MQSADLSDYVIGDTFRLIQASYVQIPPCDPLNERDPEFLQVCKFFGSFYQEPSQLLLPSQPINLALGTVLNCDERNIDGETFLSRRAIVVRSSEIFLFGFSHLQWIVNQKNDIFLRDNLLPLFDPFDLVCFAGTMIRAKHSDSLWIPAYRVANASVVFVAVETGFSNDMALACTRSQYTRNDHTY